MTPDSPGLEQIRSCHSRRFCPYLFLAAGFPNRQTAEGCLVAMNEPLLQGCSFLTPVGSGIPPSAHCLAPSPTEIKAVAEGSQYFQHCKRAREPFLLFHFTMHNFLFGTKLMILIRNSVELKRWI